MEWNGTEWRWRLEKEKGVIVEEGCMGLKEKVWLMRYESRSNADRWY